MVKDYGTIANGGNLNLDLGLSTIPIPLNPARKLLITIYFSKLFSETDQQEWTWELRLTDGIVTSDALQGTGDNYMSGGTNMIVQLWNLQEETWGMNYIQYSQGGGVNGQSVTTTLEKRPLGVILSAKRISTPINIKSGYANVFYQ